jgi:hypothetical protein
MFAVPFPNVFVYFLCNVRHQTAFFSIPDGTRHGQDLVCSHPVCRDQGVKFQFCVHCHCPVAKRNFRNRHLHIDGGVPPPQPRPAKKRKESERQSQNDSNVKAKEEEAGIFGAAAVKREAPGEGNGSGTGSLSSDYGGVVLLTERERRWAELLKTRPLDGAEDEIEKWLTEVMSVSSRQQRHEA